VILSPGQNSFNFHVVIKGILRNYDVDIDGKEFTKIFRGPGGLIGPYAEMISQTPVKYFIQAVTEAEVLIFSYKDFEKMMEKYKSWETLGRKFAERNYMEKEKKEYELMHFNSDERYDLFLKEYGPLADLIPQYQVASFLGISPEAMNRMIKKRKEI
jgi:CRP-like cAMP-binding protein